MVNVPCDRGLIEAPCNQDLVTKSFDLPGPFSDLYSELKGRVKNKLHFEWFRIQSHRNHLKCKSSFRTVFHLLYTNDFIAVSHWRCIYSYMKGYQEDWWFIILRAVNPLATHPSFDTTPSSESSFGQFLIISVIFMTLLIFAEIKSFVKLKLILPNHLENQNSGNDHHSVTLLFSHTWQMWH